MIDKQDLNYCMNRGIISEPNIESIIIAMKKQELISRHQYSYWQGKDGKWYVYLPDDKKGRVLKKRTTEEGIQEVIVNYQQNDADNPTIEEIFNNWNDTRVEMKKISKSSHSRLKQVYKRHFGEFGQKKISTISEVDVIEFLEGEIPKHGLSSKAFASLKSVTKGILKRAKRDGYISFSPTTALSDLDVSDRDFKKTIKEDYEEVFNEEETARMIEYLRNNCDIKNAGVLLLFVSGLRIGELAALKHDDLDPENNTVKVRRTETRYTENGKCIYDIKEYPKTAAGIREIVLPSSYCWLVRNLYVASADREYVFEDRGVRLTTNQIRKAEYNACRKSGVYKKSPHKIRATYDTILLDSKVDRRMVKDQMGHSDIKTSETNYHRNRKTLSRKRSIIDSIPEFCV